MMKEKVKVLFPRVGLLCWAWGQMFLYFLLSLFSPFVSFEMRC